MEIQFIKQRAGAVQTDIASDATLLAYSLIGEPDEGGAVRVLFDPGLVLPKLPLVERTEVETTKEDGTPGILEVISVAFIIVRIKK